MQKIRLIAQKIVLVLMAFVMLVMQESLVRYRHAHVLPDGMVIWHSHPYDSATGGKTHTHPAGNQFALDQYAGSVPLVGNTVTIARRYAVVFSSFKPHFTRRLLTPETGTTRLRAPPLAA